MAASEDLNEREFTLNQIKSFKNISENFIKLGINPCFICAIRLEF